MDKNSNILTLKDIEDAIIIIKKHNSCKKCNTTKSYVVLGFCGLYCKCEARKLSKTKYAKSVQKKIKQLINM